MANMHTSFKCCETIYPKQSVMILSTATLEETASMCICIVTGTNDR